MEIRLKNWKVAQKNNRMTIQGTYTVNQGATEIASQTFNEEYNSTEIAFSRGLEEEVQALTEKINKEIQESF